MSLAAPDRSPQAMRYEPPNASSPSCRPPQARLARWKLWTVIVACALVPVLCGVIFGYSGTDTRYHMGSWVDMVTAWKSGIFLPGWAQHANYGFGDPRFCFYPVLPMVAGSLLLYLLPAHLVMGTIFFVTFAVAGFSMFALARRFTTEPRALMAAALYTLSYFLLITALKHAALAELMVDAFLPLLVAYFVELMQGDRRHWARLTGLLALAWVVDVPTAIAAAYVLTIAAVMVMAAGKQWVQLAWMLAAEALAILCAGFYLVPAFQAKGTILSTDQLEYHLRTLLQSHSLQDVTLSLDAIALFLVIAWTAWRWRGRPELRAASVVLLLGAIAFFFQLPLSKPFWHLPEMRVVGFPHRFQVFLALALPIAVVVGTKQRLMAMALAAYLLAAALPFYEFHEWTNRVGPLLSAEKLTSALQQGYQGAPEYLPSGTGAVLINDDNQKLGQQTAAVERLDPGCQATATLWQPQLRVIAVRNEGAPCHVQLQLFLHPFWHFAIDGKPTMAQAGPGGVVAITVPSGTHTLTGKFVRPLLPLVAGWAVTLAGLALVLAGNRIGRTKPLR